jgi:hypothetical protein
MLGLILQNIKIPKLKTFASSYRLMVVSSGLMTSNLKPFIKWPGGKSSELELIKFYAPTKFSRYIDPFVGGGSGEYKGARGQVISKNLGNAGWSHVLELD